MYTAVTRYIFISDVSGMIIQVETCLRNTYTGAGTEYKRGRVLPTRLCNNNSRL